MADVVCNVESLEYIAETFMQLYDLNKLSFKLDKVAFINAQMKSAQASGNKERDAVLKAFKKFDTDGSGEMDSSEFASLAVELGTYPPLKQEELDEAMRQLDNSADGKISFDEFWTWWITDDVHSALEQKSANRR